MFHTPFFSRGTIVCDEGFRVVLLRRFDLMYEDEKLSLTLQRESVPGYMTIFHNSIRSAKTGEKVVLDGHTDERVFDNILRAVEWRGFQAEVITGG